MAAASATTDTILRGVPAEEVNVQVRQLILGGAVEIECSRQPNGRWTIRVR